MEQSKIDAVIGKMVDGIRDKSRGFVLDLATQASQKVADELVVRLANLHTLDPAEQQDLMAMVESLRTPTQTSVAVVEQLPPIDEYQRPADLRQHVLQSTESFIAYTKRYGKPDRSLILCDEDMAQLVIDELVDRGDREIVTMPWKPSDDWKAWATALDKPMTHRLLLRFLTSQEHNLEDASNLLPLRDLKLTSTVDIDSAIQETNEAITVSFKTNGDTSLAKFKRKIPLSVPVLDQDVTDEADWIDVTVRIEIDMPTKAGDQPMFTLRCSEWQQHFSERIEAEMAFIQGNLGDAWLVVAGTHKQSLRAIGRSKVGQPEKKTF